MVNLNKSVEDMLEEQKKIMLKGSIVGFNLGIKTADELREAYEAVQDDLANDLVQALIDTIERNIDVVYDENEDGKFTYAELGPNLADQLKDDIAEYILEKR